MSDSLSISTAENLREVFIMLTRGSVEAMRPVDMTPSRFRVLATLHGAGPLRMNDLSAMLSIVPRSVTDTVVPLERQGLVQRERDPRDGRAQVVSLTPAGRATYDAVSAKFFAAASEVLSVLDDDEKRQLEGLLKAVRDRQPTNGKPSQR
ncbi:MarR family winged helix-turn-helix transcriptional regulator [Lentzea sp. HUAS12]|uniref:MarR family winged helix-turn-helix transcriptional regulator n=1 Tax=Lentzea sp. HUAS12 TaxID=2951806 RepID=UPI0020A1091F|nr:MarR family transcriptional regulator [Lentzea sp. HUAS12]USX52995.1 MarR family transcriptional regulator [Lentzea sp. HUAS12]